MISKSTLIKFMFRQKIRKTLSDPSTIEKHMNAENNQNKIKSTNKLKKKALKQNVRQLNFDGSK